MPALSSFDGFKIVLVVVRTRGAAQVQDMSKWSCKCRREDVSVTEQTRVVLRACGV